MSLVYSLVYTQNAKVRTFGFVTSVLIEKIGYDYPYQTIEYLKDRKELQEQSDEVKALCSQIITALQARIDEIDALPDLKEFHAASMKTLRFAKERRRQINEAMEEASKRSIWREICTHIPLKAGKRTFQCIDGRYSDSMELQAMSHSVALPKTEITDPAGASRERMLFRAARKV